MPTTPTDTIKKIDEKIAQLQARKKAEEFKIKQKAKRERTKRLIEYGKIIEKYIKFDTPEQLEEHLKRLAN